MRIYPITQLSEYSMEYSNTKIIGSCSSGFNQSVGIFYWINLLSRSLSGYSGLADIIYGRNK